MDIKSAYRSINVHPDQVRYQGFCWDGEYYVSNRLTFGLSSAPYIFDKVSWFLRKVANKYGIVLIVNYLDDFLIIAHSWEECIRQRNLFVQILEFLGFQVSTGKLTEPNTSTVFLGITKR